MDMILKSDLCTRGRIKKGGDVPPSMRLICSFTRNRMVQYMIHNSPNSTELYMYNHYCMNR